MAYIFKEAEEAGKEDIMSEAVYIKKSKKTYRGGACTNFMQATNKSLNSEDYDIARISKEQAVIAFQRWLETVENQLANAEV